MKSVRGIGKTNVDLVYSGLPRWLSEGEELYAKNFEMLLGGGYPATLINLARLGLDTELVTYLGDDVFSRFAVSELQKYGVKTANIWNSEGIPVNISTIMISPRDRTIATYTSNYKPTADAEEKAYLSLKDADFVLMEALCHLDIYKQLKADGCTLVMDTGWDDALGSGIYGDYLSLADYYTPNTREALCVTGKTNALDAVISLGHEFSCAVVKLDKEGVLGYENGCAKLVKSVPEFVSVDSTGAGDNFLAGFVYGLAQNYDLSNALLCGNITGGKCVTEIGCLKGHVTRDELEQYRIKYQNLITR